MMKFTNMFNSKGELLEVNSGDIDFKPMDRRIKELNVFRVKMLEALAPYEPSDRTFDLMIQPFGFDEKLIWFTKLKLQGDDPLVKESQTAIKNPDFQYSDEQQEVLYRSVFSAFENGKTNWYLLSVEAIRLTRNICDMKYMDIELEAPVPYYAFMLTSKKNRISTEETVLKEYTEKYKHLAPNKNYYDVPLTMATALPRYEGDTIDGYIQTGMKAFQEQFIGKTDKFSNDKTFALMFLNDCRFTRDVQYPIYEELKNWVKKDPEVRKMCMISRFTDNHTSIMRGEQDAAVFICKNPFNDSPMFLVNGETIESMDELKELIRNGKCFEPAPLWWDEVKPLNKVIRNK